MRKKLLFITGMIMMLAFGCSPKAESPVPESSSPVRAETEIKIETEAEKKEDNFSVASASAEEFGRAVKEAVAAEDLEKLADLTAFPVYIGFKEGGVSVESREEMIALGEETIFTEEWMDSIAQADETALSPSKAGFVLTGENGGPNIVFGLRDGKLAVSGINY